MKIAGLLKLFCAVAGIVYIMMAAYHASHGTYPEATYELVLGIWLLDGTLKRDSIGL